MPDSATLARPCSRPSNSGQKDGVIVYGRGLGEFSTLNGMRHSIQHIGLADMSSVLYTSEHDR